MPTDRFIYWFILGWVVLIALLILLDWLADPSRGSFRPKGDRQAPDRATRRAERRRRRLEEDSSIRATLRDAYGASSLRLGWDREQEERARELDDALIVSDLAPHVVDTPSREVTGTSPESEPDGGPEPDPIPQSDPIPEPDPESGPDPSSGEDDR